MLDMTPNTHNFEIVTASRMSDSVAPDPMRVWNGTRTEYPREQTVAQIFESVAAARPDAIAVTFGGKQLSYAELNARANRLAHRLRGMGVGPETMVGCCIERSAELIVAFIAVLKAGGAYVPLDPSYPKERFDFLLTDTQTPVMLTQKSLAATVLAGRNVRSIIVDEEETVRTLSDDVNLPALGSPASLAYVMYTSGSTGQPKGVMVENRAIVRLVRNTNFCHFGPDEVFLQFAPISFDASTFEIWGPLLNGGRLVVMPPQASSLEALGKVVRENRVTTLWLTAGLFNLMVDERLEDLTTLRQFLAGGDVLSSSHVRRMLDGLPECTLINGYGPTENTTFTCCHRMRGADGVPESIPIGQPISNTQVYILDEEMCPVPPGVAGELYAAGDGVARGYLNNPGATAEKFLPNPFGMESGERMYRTGDLARWRADGVVEFLGRIDNQIKILGHRIEPGEIEATLLKHGKVRQVCVVPHLEDNGSKRLVAYYVPTSGGEVSAADLREFLAEKLPSYMVPAQFVSLHSLPLSPNGKVDRAALPNPVLAGQNGAAAEPSFNELEQSLVDLWRRVLRVERVGLDDNFFDLGGDSLLLVSVHSSLQKMRTAEIPVTDLFEFTTVRTLAKHLGRADGGGPSFSGMQQQAQKAARSVCACAHAPCGKSSAEGGIMSSAEAKPPLLEGVAIVGMAGRFPQARNVVEFWKNQLSGIEAISQFGVEDLEIPNGAELSRQPNYVRARSILDNVDMFDAEFFGIYPREAELMDPQQRLFLECCWESFEDAGYDPSAYPGPVGVYAGSSTSTYFLSRICSPEFIQQFTGGYQVGNYPEMMGNNLDFLSTRVSYKLNLRGPSFTMQAGCSTSLLAVCQACQGLLTYQSDMALAGGSSITFPQKRGYLYQEGGMVSPDGHCRTFDADAQGTVFGGGVAVVLLKRVEDAVRDGDQIYAVIRGFGVNNDGAAKVGYTAPSVEGQARVVALAHESAGVHPATIGYVEAHGTGTPLGDPIELAALAQAFRAQTSENNFCVIGTAKTNVGHLDIAAGVTGLIHAAHVVRDGVFPPTLHFKKPNPKFDLANSPFYVNTRLSLWRESETPRRAGVSAFGVGGTNAHIVIEQPPARVSQASARPAQLLVLSARSEAALDRATENLVEHLKANPELNLADLAWTLQAGRRAFSCRRTVVARDVPDAIAVLSQRDRKRAQTGLRPVESPEVCFLFPGQGSQHPNMCREIYQTERVFREAVDRCAEILMPALGADLRTLLYPAESADEETKSRVTETIVAQPAIFTIEYALAQLWMSWGVRPQAMLGHSVGEFVAACLAGVFSLEDALGLIAARGRMMQELPGGGMLSVRLPESEVAGRLQNQLNGRLSLAAVNSPTLCVVAGPFDALDAFEQQLNRDGVASRRLTTSHAFHSAMMDPIIDPFMAEMAKVRLSPPRIPYVSGVTGKWITAKEATDAAYWARHFRQAVQFSAGVVELQKSPRNVLLEVGPGNILATLARQHVGGLSDQVIVSSLTDGYTGEGDATSLMNALGSIWLAGVQPKWSAVLGGERRHRISLPTYPFERKRFWLDASAAEKTVAPPASVATEQIQEIEVRPNPQEEKIPVPPLPQVPSVAAGVVPRTTRIRTMLAEVFEDLSGMQFSQVDSSTTFLELGLDSLFLTQVTQSLQDKFGLKITFRQLLGDQGTLDSLAEYVDAKLPADVLAAAPVTAPAQAQVAPASVQVAPASLPTNSNGHAALDGSVMGGSAMDRLMRDQLEAMQQLFARQLDAMRGVSASLPTAPIVPAATPSSIAATVAPVVANPVAKVDTPSGSAAQAKEDFQAHGPHKPPQKGTTSAELTERHAKHLNALVASYTRRTAKSKSMTQETRLPMADPRVVAGFRAAWKEMIYPIITNRSKGSKLWDLDGNEYIDILNGFGPIMLGHRPEFVEKAIEKQLHEGFETGPMTPLAGEVAKMFCEMSGNERMAYCNTGSEAVMAAMRIARTVTGRNKVVMFTGDYHGMFDEVLAKGIKKAGLPQSMPVAPGIPREKVANLFVLDYGTPETLEWIRAHAQELAAVLVEPVQSRHPNFQPREFLKEVRKITEEAGTALIFDEVVTGFRVHPGGCQALFGIRADLATYGKVVAGGMPIGVVAGKAAFMDALDGGAWQYGDDSFPEVGVTFFAGTFVRHPLTLAAVKSVLLHFKEEGPALQEKLTANTAGMVRRINEFFEQHSVPTRLETFGSIFYFSFPTDERFASLFYYYLRLKGIHVLEGFPCFLTTTHSAADIDRIVQVFQESALEMQKGGFFPEPADATQGTSKAQESTVPGTPQETPITESQLEVWLSDQLGDDASCSYNESFTLHMRGTVNEPVLREAIHKVLDRHDALRATFDAEGKTQRFAAKLELNIPTQDLSSLNPQGRQERLQQIIEKDAYTPFKLAQGPLVRAQFVKMEPRYQLVIFTSHHIVCDGWSTNILVDEIARTYNALNKGVACDLPKPMSFATYARSQADFFNSPEGSANEEYWVEQFRKPVPPLELPTDRPRPPVKEFAGATHRKKIGAEAYSAIKRGGAKQKCTLFVTLLSGLQLLLSRLTGQDDIVVGIPSAGQSLLDDGALVGHCVNFLPLRGFTTGDPTAAAYLAQTRQTLLEAYDHQNYTYGRLVRRLSLQRDPSRLPLTEVQFNLEKVGAGLQFDGFEPEVDPNPKSFVNFDIFLNVIESKDGLIVDCDYNKGLFDEATIARWLSHYETLLLGMVTGVDLHVSRLPLLTEVEREQIIVDCNATSADYPRNACVHQLIEAQAKASPNAVAVVFEAEQLSYAELNHRAEQLARYLRKLGVKPGVLVGLYVERSLDMIVGLLGVMKAGGAYVPMDPTYPAERISFVLADANVPVLLTQKKLGQHLPPNSTHVVYLDADKAEIDHQANGTPSVSATSEDLAYVIYTSGSTGKPKGVEVSHRAVVNLLSSMRKKPGLNSKDTLLAVTTLSFDIAGLEMYLPLSVGAKLVIASRESAADGAQLLARLVTSGATVIQATPVTFRFLIEAGWTGNPKLKVLCGGEALPRELANQLAERTGSLWNMYGPTETTIWSSTVQVQPGNGPVTIGLPIDNTQFYVLDEHGQVVPIGVPGELHIGGDGVARGYFQRPELTTAKFVRNPFSIDPTARFYKTGDLVRRLPDGTLEFLGRIDNQVKLRGFRIELGEIETILARYPGIREAVVTLREDVPGDRRLVAYVTSDHQGLTVTAVREFMTGKLPNYMLPSAVVRVDAMPLTPNGKVDRKALPAPQDGGTSRQKEFVEPRTPKEKQLAEIWCEVLHLERVGIQDNLFEIGADSLHIFQIAARANKAGITIASGAIPEISDHYVIAGTIGERHHLRGHGNGWDCSGIPGKVSAQTAFAMTPKELFGLPPVEPGTQPSVKGAPGSDATGELFVLPASFGQERFWGLDRLNPGNPTWNVPVRFRLQGSLNTTFVAHAFNEIVRRHETLRTTFTLAEGQLSQVIRSVLAIEVPVTDLRQLLKSERDAEVDRLSFEEARRRFDLSVGPLFRVSLLQTENQEHVLLVTPHHSIADYISIGLISNELGALYEAYSRGAEPVLPALTIQYGDFAVWQKEQSTGAIVQKELAYWKEQLKDLPLLEFPTDHPRLASPTYDASITSILLPPKLTDAMKELGNRNGATLFNTMLATLAIVMHQYTGQNDFGVATQVSGRTNVELEPLIGLFINNVVLRTDLSGDPLFSQLLTRVQEVGLQSLANQNVRFEQVLKELRPQDYPSHHTLFRLNFICQRDPVKPLEFAGIKLSVIPSKSQGALYDLNVFLVQRAEGWRLACEYNTDLFELSTITRLLGDYRALMESVIDNSDRHLSEFPLLEGAALYKETVRLKALAFTASPALATGHEATGGGTADGIPAKSAVQNSSPSAANPTEDGGAEIYAMPPSAAQRRFWVLEELAPGNPALHMRACLQLVGALSETALEKSLQILVNRHETLRTTFEMRDNELVQVIAPSRQIPLTVTSLEDGPAAKQESRLAESIRAEVSAPFDLSRGPLIRARLFRMAPQKHVLVITTHHIIVDGWSQNVIQNDLWKAYEALSAGREPQLPPLAIQYADFVHWQEKWLDSDGAREQLAFWRKQLSAPLSVLNIPTDRPRRHRLTSQGGMETMLLPDGLVRSLKDVCQAQGISMFMATLGCFAALLNRYTGQDDVLIGSPVANRRLEAESLIGPFAGPVTLRLNLSHNPTWRELFGRIRDTTVDALGHADFPFEVLIENLDVRSVHGRNPLSQCYFFYQASFLKAREANGLTVNPLPDFALGTFFELQMALLERSEGVRVQLEYSSDLFEPATIRRILQDYSKLLEDMVTGQERRMDQLPIAAPSKVQPAPNTGASPAEIHGKHIAPRDPLEQSLASVWAKVLRVDHVGVRDDFFDLGGHSLAAVRLLTEVQRLAGRTLPLATLFQASTVEAMAKASPQRWLDSVLVIPRAHSPGWITTTSIPGARCGRKRVAVPAVNPIYGA